MLGRVEQVCVKGDGEGDWLPSMYFIAMYESKIIKQLKLIYKLKREIWKGKEGVRIWPQNICYVHVCKCHSKTSFLQLMYANKKEKK
jgi:hypothetical protein